jgi:hypothetical protein
MECGTLVAHRSMTTVGTVVPRGHRSRGPYTQSVAGELLDIGLRPRLVASFEPPDAEARFAEWRRRHEGALGSVPPERLRVEYGRTGEGVYVRVRIDEAHVPEALASS